jgi:hypothetical protein
MPPKGAKKAAAKAKTAAAAVQVAAAAAANPAPAAEPNVMAKPLQVVEDANVQHLQKLEDAIQTVTGHHVFQNIMHESPPKIDKDAQSHEAGMQAGFVELNVMYNLKQLRRLYSYLNLGLLVRESWT